MNKYDLQITEKSKEDRRKELNEIKSIDPIQIFHIYSNLPGLNVSDLPVGITSREVIDRILKQEYPE